MIGNFISDFVALSYKLIIEVDGGIHKQQEEEAKNRTSKLNEREYKVIRLTNEEVFNDINAVLEKIKNELRP
ncbi:MAG: DUF559 domain-containing protein [Paludibacter sp.]|nr:DUF559 domain-containing protein [Paludibacter sp.]